MSTHDLTGAAAEPPPPSDAEHPGANEAIEATELTDSEWEDLLEAERTSLVVSYSGQDFDIAGLVRRMNQHDILVPTFGHDDTRIASAGFQRSFVWTRPQMDRFIESLLLGYPIPGIFLVRQADRRYLVLDGQQRLRTLQRFYQEVHDGKEFSLRNVDETFKGLTYGKLSEEQRRLIDDTFIQATIVAFDGSRESLEAVYQIFERLNSGGTQLTPHEIRVALFAGPFIDFLDSLNNDASWRALYGKPSPRLRDQELVLRILALYLAAPTYRRPLKTFLNEFVSDYRNSMSASLEPLRSRFKEASRLLAENAGRSALRLHGYQINAALTEAIYVGLMRRLDHGTPVEGASVRRALQAIEQEPQMDTAVSRSTADEESVRTRLEIATAEFARI